MEIDNGKADSEREKAHPQEAIHGAQPQQDDAAREAAVKALRQWRQWKEGPYTSLVEKGIPIEQIMEWTIQLEEDLVEQEVPEGAVGALCTRAGLQHLDKQQALAALAVYRERKQL